MIGGCPDQVLSSRSSSCSLCATPLMGGHGDLWRYSSSSQGWRCLTWSMVEEINYNADNPRVRVFLGGSAWKGEHYQLWRMFNHARHGYPYWPNTEIANGLINNSVLVKCTRNPGIIAPAINALFIALERFSLPDLVGIG